MTPISSNTTSFLHNIGPSNTEESQSHFDILFSESYLEEESFNRLNLATTFNELKDCFQQGDPASIDILFSLTSRKDQIGKAATQVLIEIKDQSSVGTHERDYFDDLCNTFYQQCRLNEDNNHSPQLFQLSTELLTMMLDVQLKRNNDTRNQDIFNIIQLLQKKSAVDESHLVKTSDSYSTSVTMAEDDGFIIISSPKNISPFDNHYKDTLTTTTAETIENHIMDNNITKMNNSTLHPYLSLSEQNQLQDSALSHYFGTQKIDSLSQTRHEFIEFLQKLRESTPFSDRIMDKLIHKWDFNNPIFIPKPEVNTDTSTVQAMTLPHWQLDSHSSPLKESILGNVNTSIPTSVTPKISISSIQTKIEDENKQKVEKVLSQTKKITDRLPSWLSSLFNKNNN
ncbi:hypothetical protein [Shewanella surugensis]|uniref:Uncharacterized protein n=1 Tax=Shewanella surugensis TaxID=212020 RepID=A0ABT0L649_9GAMM|nr:hypothetical protein [Shewanella surugensis]MCL1123140.1 hypothetical protein [Shewanella surugensis]